MIIKSYMHLRKHLNILIKGVFMIIMFIAVSGSIHGQNSNKNKNKISKKIDSLAKLKLSALKTDKVLIPVDTVKKIIPLFDQSDQGIDSLFIGKGKFKLFKKSAHASYYADKFHNRKTASGKKYDKNKLTAAHKKLPFGTIVRVTNEANSKSILVEITDRGPFIKSREIDLSRRAFMDITASKASGKMNVTLEILQK